MMSEMIEQWLHDLEIKATAPRALVLEELMKAARPITADDIMESALLGGTKISYSTCYRVLATFEEKEMLDIGYEIALDKKTYALKGRSPCCVLRCVNCSKCEPVEACELHDLFDKLAQQYAFMIKQHKLELTGLCSDCKNR